jgi:membrane protein DedA with SNARE-associated domain
VVGAGCAGLALYGADSRTAMVAAAAGFVTVVLMYTIGRGFEGRRALRVVLALLLGGRRRRRVRAPFQRIGRSA